MFSTLTCISVHFCLFSYKYILLNSVESPSRFFCSIEKNENPLPSYLYRNLKHIIFSNIGMAYFVGLFVLASVAIPCSERLNPKEKLLRSL